MALPKIDEIRNLSDQEIEDQILAVKRQLFELRFQKGTRRLEKPHEFKHNRHRLAQLMTIERERQLQKQSEN
jgi:large subunit ribosomal protein L29